MLPIIILVFVAAFAIVALVSLALRPRSASPEQVQATLASALKISRFSRREEAVDIRKNTALSSIAWIDRLLGQIDGAVRLQLLLDQADLTWLPGRLLLSMGALA